ncbi:hypothetical protein FA13DRAFT_207241 [Coprinellus micaceus]|uniref:Uncharacterized protein n=1 Tax=Coprinellus micaceus TaxID=71717 RepID=A0A4Y7SFC5_COPMI|nr:hypothetical protein FA13DRAFT_207241 [Coprinellus micaceus]
MEKCENARTNESKEGKTKGRIKERATVHLKATKKHPLGTTDPEMLNESLGSVDEAHRTNSQPANQMKSSEGRDISRELHARPRRNPSANPSPNRRSGYIRECPTSGSIPKRYRDRRHRGPLVKRLLGTAWRGIQGERTMPSCERERAVERWRVWRPGEEEMGCEGST